VSSFRFVLSVPRWPIPGISNIWISQETPGKYRLSTRAKRAEGKQRSPWYCVCEWSSNRKSADSVSSIVEKVRLWNKYMIWCQYIYIYEKKIGNSSLSGKWKKFENKSLTSVGFFFVGCSFVSFTRLSENLGKQEFSIRCVNISPSGKSVFFGVFYSYVHVPSTALVKKKKCFTVTHTNWINSSNINDSKVSGLGFNCFESVILSFFYFSHIQFGKVLFLCWEFISRYKCVFSLKNVSVCLASLTSSYLRARIKYEIH
jgi:hypothetical protein